MQNNGINEALAVVLALPILMMMLGVIVNLIGFVFWVMMLVDCLKNEEENKIAWILTIIFLPLFGAILYYTIVKKKRWLINTMFVGGVLATATVLITLAYLGRYGNTVVQAKKTNIAINYKNQQAATKQTIITQLPILNLPFKFTHNQNQGNNSVYLPQLSAPTKIYKTRNTSNRYTAPKKYIYTWKDENQQEHYSNMQPPAGAGYTKKESRY